MTSPLNAPLKPDPKRPYKAYAGGLISGALTLIYLLIQNASDKRGLTSGEFWTDLGLAVLATGLTGAGTFLKKNPHIPVHHR